MKHFFDTTHSWLFQPRYWSFTAIKMFQPITAANEGTIEKDGPSSWQVSSVDLNSHPSANTMNTLQLFQPPNFSHSIPYLWATSTEIQRWITPSKALFLHCPLAGCTQSPRKWLVHLPVVTTACRNCSTFTSLFSSLLSPSQHTWYKDLQDRRRQLFFFMLICSVTADTDNEHYKLCHFDIKDCQSREQVVAFL